MMECIVAGGLLVLVVIALMLHAAHLEDMEKIAKVDRHIKVLMDATMQGREASPSCETEADMTNPPRRHENGSEIAISEGVQRGRGNH